jgi:ABC-2 type transport system permease protein
MIGALVYLQLTSLRNALSQRLRRLRHPRYLAGAIVGFAYFYFFFFRHFFSGRGRPALSVAGWPALTVDWPALLEPLGALVLFVVVALAWILPKDRAALQFTEAEVAFLFPAPVARRTLVHFKLIKSQLAILITSLFLALFSNRWSFLGGNAAIHAAGWWLIFSLLNLHLLGASFARERLLDFGLDPARRRLIAFGVLALLGAATWLGLRHTLALPTDADFAGPEAMLRYGQAVLAAPPLGWVLWPFRLAVRPFLATDASAFLWALGPALLLLVGHYLWVVRSDVAFEEASLALSQKRSERIAAIRAGQWRGPASRAKPRREPFALAATGPAPFAFLWKSLIAAGPMYYPRSWLTAAAVCIAGTLWLNRDPQYRPFMQVIGGASLGIGGYALLLGPMLFRRGLNLMLTRLDVVKTYPLRGWQIVLGEMLTPIALLTAFEWLLLTLAALGVQTISRKFAATPFLPGAGAVGVGLLVPPLGGMMFAIPFAATLYFPAWMGTGAQRGGGIEMMGQRLIFFAGYVVVLIVTLVPAAAVGAVPFVVLQLLTGSLPLAVLAAGLTASAALVGEFALVIWWLGHRYEDFDLSAELPR